VIHVTLFIIFAIENGYELSREDISLETINEIKLLHATHVQSILPQLKISPPAPNNRSTSTQNILG
jgi:hypothetical protein